MVGQRRRQFLAALGGVALAGCQTSELAEETNGATNTDGTRTTTSTVRRPTDTATSTATETPTDTATPTESPTPTPVPDELEYQEPHVTLVSYGVNSAIDEYGDLPAALESGFEEATDGRVSPTAEWSSHSGVPDHDFSTVFDREENLTEDGLKDPDDDTRLWYYYHEATLEEEVLAKARAASSKRTDVAMVVTDLQHPGRGIYYGTDGDAAQKQSVALVNGLLLGGWANEQYVRVDMEEDRLLDTMYHELGHYYGTGHREDNRACVMSHGRSANDDPFPFAFCDQSITEIEEKL